MKTMVLKEICEIKTEGRPRLSDGLPLKTEPLELVNIPIPMPGPEDILIKVAVCGVCHTELDQIEGRILPVKLPVILGHQPVGVVVDKGAKVSDFKVGDRVGATWIFSSCRKCRFCRDGQENLCEDFKGTGCSEDGGYAEYMVISHDFAHKIPDGLTEFGTVAPLMCAGVVGYRSLKLSGMKNGKTLGLYGFGSANHLVIQIVNFLYPDSKKFVVTRNPDERKLAMDLGADWAGDIEDTPPEKLDCAIDTTPVWKPFLFALENLEKGGRLVINAIRKEEIDKEILLGIDYRRHLWFEKEIKTIANVTRQDGKEFLELAARIQIKPQIRPYLLEEANNALVDLKSGKSTGSKILKISDEGK